MQNRAQSAVELRDELAHRYLLSSLLGLAGMVPITKLISYALSNNDNYETVTNVVGLIYGLGLWGYVCYRGYQDHQTIEEAFTNEIVTAQLRMITEGYRELGLFTTQTKLNKFLMHQELTEKFAAGKQFSSR